MHKRGSKQRRQRRKGIQRYSQIRKHREVKKKNMGWGKMKEREREIGETNYIQDKAI